MSNPSVTIKTSQGPITVTVRDMEKYITGLAQNSTKPSNDPYTDYSSTQPRQLTESQLTTAMKDLGYSKRQISNVTAGNVGGGGWLSDAIQGLAGGLVAVGPEGSGLGDALDAILPGAADVAPVVEDSPAIGDLPRSGIEDTSPAEDTAPSEEGSPSNFSGPNYGLPPGLSNLLGKYGGEALFLPLLAWIMTGRNWVRVLEYVGGAAMIFVAMRELAKG